jgi:hypothetical protein
VHSSSERGGGGEGGTAGEEGTRGVRGISGKQRFIGKPFICREKQEKNWGKLVFTIGKLSFLCFDLICLIFFGDGRKKKEKPSNSIRK